MARKRPVPEPAPEPAANLAGLVQACKDEPDEDGLRLILADYLEDHGEPERAELIRLSLATAGVEPASVAALRARLARLRCDHEARWLAGFPTASFPVYHRRGFHHFACGGGDQAGLVARIRSAALEPWAEGVTIRFFQGQGGIAGVEDEVVRLFPVLVLSGEDLEQRLLQALVNNPHAADLRALHLNLMDAPPETSRLLFLPTSGMTGLCSLTLAGEFPAEEARELARAPFAPRLRTLSIQSPTLTPAHLAAFAVGTLENLRVLRLRWGSVPTVEIPAGLRELRLDQLGLTDAGVTAIVTSPRVASLEVLSLTSNGLTAAAVRALANSPHLANLRRLHLADHQIGAEGIRALAESPFLAGLETLDLSLNHGTIGSDDLLPLFQSEHFPALTDLALRGAQVTDRSLGALLAGPLVPCLRRLNLGGNPLGSAGAAHLAACPALRHLETLELNRCGVGDHGLTVLAKSRTLERLVWLSVDTREPINAGLVALASGVGLPALVFLHVGATDSRGIASSALAWVKDSPSRGGLFPIEVPETIAAPDPFARLLLHELDLG